MYVTVCASASASVSERNAKREIEREREVRAASKAADETSDYALPLFGPAIGHSFIPRMEVPRTAAATLQTVCDHLNRSTAAGGDAKSAEAIDRWIQTFLPSADALYSAPAEVQPESIYRMLFHIGTYRPSSLVTCLI